MPRYTAPAEEAPHARTWMCWPSTPSIYGGPSAYFEEVQSTIGRLASAIADFEPVAMLADAALHDAVRAQCGPNVELVDIPTRDMWARDSGPVFVTSPTGMTAAVKFNFNGWGGKQAPGADADVAAAIGAKLGADVLCAEVVGEGGGIEFDGDGTLLLTDSCWLNDNRNPGKDAHFVEAELKRLLGVEQVVWLPGVRGHDVTDGHIDGSIRFIRPGLVMTSGYADDDTVWGDALREAVAILRRTTDARGRAFEIVHAPSAGSPRSSHPEILTSYANFYVANGALFTPSFGDHASDARAVRTFETLFPGRKVVALNVDRIYENGGGIHCVTQQQPA